MKQFSSIGCEPCLLVCHISKGTELKIEELPSARQRVGQSSKNLYQRRLVMVMFQNYSILCGLKNQIHEDLWKNLRISYANFL